MTSTSPDGRHHPHVGLRAQVVRAAAIVAPLWPLRSFVAVNPLGGLGHLSFDDAAAEARRWLGARTHLCLREYREALARGAVGEADLRRAVAEVAADAAALPALEVAGRTVTAVDVVMADLLHGPEPPRPEPLPTAGRRRDHGIGEAESDAIDGIVANWCAAFVDETGVPWALPGRERGLFAAWRDLASTDRRLRRLVGPGGCRWLDATPPEADDALVVALDALGVGHADRDDELRAQLARLPGWAGYARWCDEWAPHDRPGPALHLLDLVAVRATIEAAAVRSRPVALPVSPAEWHVASGRDAPSSLDARVAAVLSAFGVAGDLVPADEAAEPVRTVLRLVPEAARGAVWLAAHEGAFRDRLLASMSASADRGADAGTSGGVGRTPRPAPEAQAVFCIDVRSEGLRRHLEAQGRYETLGFAGFFGVPVRWRPLGATSSEARCPVLVTPMYEVVERPVTADEVASHYAKERAADAALRTFHATKGGAASPFALAEAAGWLAGPVAAVRTLAAPRRPTGWRERMRRQPPTTPAVDRNRDPESGLALEERALFAEAILSTMGLTDGFAPLVLLCGHGSRTVNNPHASALDCGACGGAPGGASARVAAAILNDSGVRDELVHRGIAVPADTWFVAAEHDTASDRVEVLDRHAVPAVHARRLALLERDLARAGELLAHERGGRLPGPSRARGRVRARGRDWAQVRPEWGLAGNAAFVIGPRSATRDLDMACRVFLHSYDPDADTEGVALETIMTAPLVVAQWISAQYYFSTVEPEVFGAGDKMLHNPVGGVGVVLGEGGDLRVGLPLQSVTAGAWSMHEPLRLLAVVQAPLDRVDAVVARNRVLSGLFGGGWITLAARAAANDDWSVRRPDGVWAAWRPTDGAPRDTVRSLEVTR